MHEPTYKLYYEDFELAEAEVRIVAIEGDLVITDKTICYPEGGGQLGDQGWLGDLRIVDTQKRGGRVVVRQDLPVVSVETQVVHRVEGNVDALAPGDRVTMKVDADRREACTRLHGAIHVAMGRINEAIGRDGYMVKGCRIAPDGARIDFGTAHVFGGGFLERLQQGVDKWIAEDLTIELEPVNGVPEMYIWHCPAAPDLLDQPCGGTHKRRLSELGRIKLRRKRPGAGIERLYVSLEDSL